MICSGQLDLPTCMSACAVQEQAITMCSAQSQTCGDFNSCLGATGGGAGGGAGGGSMGGGSGTDGGATGGGAGGGSAARDCNDACNQVTQICPQFPQSNCLNGCAMAPQAYDSCAFTSATCNDFALCLLNATTDAGMGGGAGGGAGGGTGGGGATGGGGGAQMPVPDVTSISCSNLGDPRVNWTGGTTSYYFINRLSSATPTSCRDTGAQLISGTVGSNSRSMVCGAPNEVRVVWVCGVDPNDSNNISPGKKIQVTCPQIVNNMLQPGTCQALP